MPLYDFRNPYTITIFLWRNISVMDSAQVSAFTVTRNCDSGMDAIVNAWRVIQVGDGMVEDRRVFVPALVKTLKNNEAYVGSATHVI